MMTQWPGNRLWTFQADMNGDGAVTVSDIWLWLKWLWFYPGDWILLQFGPTKIGKFFELSPQDYGGRLSGFITFALVAFFVYMLVEVVSRRAYLQTTAGKAEAMQQEAESKAKAQAEKTINESRPWYSKRHSGWWVLVTYAAMGLIIYIVTLVA